MSKLLVIDLVAISVEKKKLIFKLQCKQGFETI